MQIRGREINQKFTLCSSGSCRLHFMSIQFKYDGKNVRATILWFTTAQFALLMNVIVSQEDANRGKPNWEHLADDLHVLITVEDTENRAKVKLQRAVEEVQKLLVPVSLNFTSSSLVIHSFPFHNSKPKVKMNWKNDNWWNLPSSTEHTETRVQRQLLPVSTKNLPTLPPVHITTIKRKNFPC